MRTLARAMRRQWRFHVMLIPAVILIAIFSYIPFYGIIIAFQKYNPAMGFNSPWVGLGNFRFLFNQPSFVTTIWNTLFIATMKLVGGIIVPVIIALLLNEIDNSTVKRIFQTIIYVPNFISWVIMAGLLLDILSSDGVVNRALSAFGLAPISFLGDARIFPWTLIVSDIWKTFGFGTVIYMATLAGIDPGLYEAAKVDGAKRWKQTLYITIPLMLPIITLMSILSLGNILNAGFDQIYNLYAPIVYKTGDVIDTYIYRLAFESAQYSIGTAVGIFKSLVSGLLIMASYLLADRLAGYRVF